MAERFKALVLKTSDGQLSVGSNPTLSASRVGSRPLERPAAWPTRTVLPAGSASATRFRFHRGLLAPAGTQAKGVVVEIATNEDGKSYFAVEGLEEFEGLDWCHSFWRRQLRADKPQSSTTAQLSLP
jgi:hypothetical protein